MEMEGLAVVDIDTLASVGPAAGAPGASSTNNRLHAGKLITQGPLRLR